MRRLEQSHLLRINASLFSFQPVPDDLPRPWSKWYEEGKIHSTLAEYMVRSKSGVIITNLLFDREIPFTYEMPLMHGRDLLLARLHDHVARSRVVLGASRTDGQRGVSKPLGCWKRTFSANCTARFLAKILYRHPRIRNAAFRLHRPKTLRLRHQRRHRPGPLPRRPETPLQLLQTPRTVTHQLIAICLLPFVIRH